MYFYIGDVQVFRPGWKLA